MAQSGKFADAAAKGRVFSISTVTAGLAIPITSTTAPTVALWNPLGSGVRVNLLRYVLAYASGTTVATPVGFQFASGAGNIVDAKGVYSVFADSAIVPALLGQSAGSRCRASAAGTNTLTAAIVAWISTGIGLDAQVAATTNPAVNETYDFDGLLQLLPGNTVFPCGTAASGALFAQTLYWEEIPITE